MFNIKALFSSFKSPIQEGAPELLPGDRVICTNVQPAPAIKGYNVVSQSISRKATGTVEHVSFLKRA